MKIEVLAAVSSKSYVSPAYGKENTIAYSNKDLVDVSFVRDYDFFSGADTGISNDYDLLTKYWNLKTNDGHYINLYANGLRLAAAIDYTIEGLVFIIFPKNPNMKINQFIEIVKGLKIPEYNG